MITKTEMRTIKVQYTCDDCKKGTMVFDGPLRGGTDGIWQYHHCCSNRDCNSKGYLGANEKYPYFEYEPVA